MSCCCFCCCCCCCCCCCWLSFPNPGWKTRACAARNMAVRPSAVFCSTAARAFSSRWRTCVVTKLQRHLLISDFTTNTKLIGKTMLSHFHHKNQWLYQIWCWVFGHCLEYLFGYLLKTTKKIWWFEFLTCLNFFIQDRALINRSAVGDANVSNLIYTEPENSCCDRKYWKNVQTDLLLIYTFWSFVLGQDLLVAELSGMV